MITFIQQLLNGIVLGSEYALYAAGLALVFGCMRAFNFGYSASFLVASYALWVTTQQISLPWSVGIIIALILGALASLLTERVAFWPFRRKGLDNYLTESIASVALNMVLVNLVVIIWDADPRGFEKSLFSSPLNLGSLTISPILLIILCVSIVIMALLAWFMQKTKAGKAIRATAFNSSTARLLGVNPEKIRVYTFLAAGALCAAAGILMSMFFGAVSPFIGESLLLKSFAVVVIGGVGSIRGAAVTGILLGIAESFTVAYVSSGARDITVYVLLFLILVIRPHGLFGKSEVTRA